MVQKRVSSPRKEPKKPAPGSRTAVPDADGPKKRGRPRKPDTRRKFVMDNIHLVVKRKDRWSGEDRETWREVKRIVFATPMA